MAERATILYIEDDPGSQSLVQRTLSFAGYRVVVASRGIEGLDLAVNAQKAYNQEIVSRLESKIRELESNNAELRRLDKIKEDFIQLTAHELRTPLTLVYGYSRLLQESPIVRQLRESSPEIQAFISG